MSELNKYISQQISTLIPKYEKVEISIYVNDTSYSVDFFVTIAGKRMQCLDMVDNGLIKEKELDVVTKAIADYVRNSSNYQSEEVNKIFLEINA